MAVDTTTEEEPFSYLDGLRFDDTDNAKRLVTVSGGTLRYVHGWGKFLLYSDGVWHVDHREALTMEMAKGVSEKLYEDHERAQAELDASVGHGLVDEVSRKKLQRAIDALDEWAKYSAMRSGRSNMVYLARGTEGLVIEHEQLEANPYLVNVENGTMDYGPVKADPENGMPIFRHHDPEDLLLLQAPTRYDPDATCPLWDSCLEQWQPDSEMREYLQMRAGACILGVPTETLDVDYGSGANGKSKFHGALQNAIGSGPTGYSIVPHKSLLMAQRFDEHATVYADLFRKRMACATETKAGETLDEESVKSLTGGDRMKGRRMREDFWEYQPSHTLILHTNYRPRIKGTDEAIWRRVHLVPWEVTIPENERDEKLAEKLADEAPGILRWVLIGAMNFLRDGWWVPEAVEVATDEYREGEDTLGKFLRDCVDITKDPDDVEFFSWVHTQADEWRKVEGLQWNFSARQLAEGLTKAGAWKGKRVNVLMSKATEWHGLKML
jgi:putative DNA primase/helicase